jgi:hypothetical protein
MATRFVPKPKERRKVAIPADLRDSLREVFDLIQQAKDDPDIILDFDDAIQVGGVCGGRYGKKARPYVLTYYPEGDTKRGKWYMTLHGTEIEDIADGRMSEISMYCCTSTDCRCKFREEKEACSYCDYEQDDATRQFKARLENLSKEVHSKGEWVLMYVREKPDATAASLIGDYNPIDALGDRLGWFSYEEAEEMIQAARSRL